MSNEQFSALVERMLADSKADPTVPPEAIKAARVRAILGKHGHR